MRAYQALACRLRRQYPGESHQQDGKSIDFTGGSPFWGRGDFRENFRDEGAVASEQTTGSGGHHAILECVE